MLKIILASLLLMSINSFAQEDTNCDMLKVHDEIKSTMKNHEYSENYDISMYTRVESIKQDHQKLKVIFSKAYHEGNKNFEDITFHKTGKSYWAYTFFTLDPDTCEITKDKYNYPIKVVFNDTGVVWNYNQ